MNHQERYHLLVKRQMLLDEKREREMIMAEGLRLAKDDIVSEAIEAYYAMEEKHASILDHLA